MNTIEVAEIKSLLVGILGSEGLKKNMEQKKNY